MNIEESIQQIKTLIEAWKLDEVDLNQTDINAMQVLLKENEELKLQLKGTTHCFDEEEHEKLKKQLEEYKDKINWYENFEVNKTIDKLRLKHNNQQKEFIEYLENEIYSFELRGTSPEYNFENVLKRILLKYKEIIGVEDENNMGK